MAEALDRILGTFPPSLSAKAERSLTELGVAIRTNHAVVGLDDRVVTMNGPDGEVRVPTRTAIWAAGVTASPLAKLLADAAGTEVDRAGRLAVGAALTVPGQPDVYAIGDMVRTSTPLLGVAPVAIQQGRYVARTILARRRGEKVRPFRYLDKGNVATIGRVVLTRWLFSFVTRRRGARTSSAAGSPDRLRPAPLRVAPGGPASHSSEARIA